MEEKDSESDKGIMRDKKLFLERDVLDVLLLKAVFGLGKLGKKEYKIFLNVKIILRLTIEINKKM